MIIRWTAVNVLTLLFIIGWGMFRGFESHILFIGVTIAQTAFALFLINLNMYFAFLLIRKSKKRKVKIKLATIARKMMKHHVPIAITATFLVTIHAVIVLSTDAGPIWRAKTVAGIAAFFILCFLLYSGYLRHKKATGKRRKLHYMIAFSFFGSVLLHVFL